MTHQDPDSLIPGRRGSTIDHADTEVRAVWNDVRYLCERIAASSDGVDDVKRLKRIQGRLTKLIQDCQL